MGQRHYPAHLTGGIYRPPRARRPAPRRAWWSADRPRRRYESTKHAKTWEDLGVKEHIPFRNVSYFAAQQQGSSLPLPTGRQQTVTAYSWSLRDIVQRGLFLYLFAEADANDANFGALALDIESWLTRERVANDGSVTREVRTDSEQPQ